MKSLSILLFMILSLQAHGQGDLSGSLKGQAQTAKSLFGTLEVRNQQATKTGAVSALIESENTNLLINPSFEHQTYDFGWANSGGASAVETSVVIDGKKSLKSTQTNTFVSLVQLSSLFAAQFADGVQGVASAYVKSPYPLKMCAVKAGGTTDLCTLFTQGNGKWEFLELPFVFGATNNGFEIKTDVQVTGAFYVDKAFLGISKVLANQTAVGPWIAFTPTVAPSTGSITNYVSTGRYRQIGQTIEVEGKITFSGASAVFSMIDVSIPGQFTMDSTTLTSTTLGSSSGSDFGVRTYPAGPIEYFSPTTVRLFGAAVDTFTGTQPIKNAPYTNTYPFTYGASDSIMYRYTVTVPQLNASFNTISGTNANTGWASFTPTPTWTTNTTWSGKWRRQGSMLEMNVLGTFTGAPNVATLTIPIPFGLTIDRTNKMVTVADSNVVDGKGTGKIGTGYFSFGPYINATDTQVVRVGSLQQVTTHTGTVFPNDTDLTNTQPAAIVTGNYIQILVKVPILGWEDSNSIVANISETPTTRGTNGSDIQSVYFGSGTNCSTACTTGNCTICTQVGSKITTVSWSATGNYRLNGIDGTKYICSFGGYGGGWLSGVHDKNLSTSSYAQITIGTGALVATNTAYNSATCIGVP